MALVLACVMGGLQLVIVSLFAYVVFDSYAMRFYPAAVPLTKGKSRRIRGFRRD